LARICSVKGCKNKHKGRGFCDTHLAKEIFTDSKLCTHDGCNNKHKGRGYCDKHLQRLRKWGDVNFVPDPKIANAKRAKSSKGHSVSKQTREKISKANSNPSKQTRKKLSESHKGKRVPKIVKQKISISLTGRKLTKEHAEKSRIGLTGLKRSPQQRKNISKGRMGIKFSKEHLKNLSISHRGHKASEVTRKRMSISIKKTYDENPELRQKLSDIQSTPERKQLQREVMRQVRHNQQKPNLKELKIKEILTNAGLVFNPEQDLNRFNQQSDKSNFGMFINIPFSHTQLEQKFKEVDFLIQPNKIIEHNGGYDHADPRKYKPNDKIRKTTAKTIWKKEKMIHDSLKIEGYEILVVWQLDLDTDAENTTKKILKFAKS